jgi:hypothetical protein
MLIASLAYLPFFAIALVAQWSDRYGLARRVTFGLLLLVDGLVALAGLVAVYMSLLPMPEVLVPAGEPDLLAIGLGLLATAAAAPVLLIAPVRRGLARLIPIDPDSGVHATALALAVLMVGLTLAQLPLIGGLEALASSTVQFEFLELLLPLLPIGLFALVGVGYLIRRDGPQTRRRLGIGRLSGRDVALSAGLAVGILAAYYGVDWVWRTLAPENYALMEAVGEVLYGGVVAPWQGILISLTAAVTEELLFRGAVQPRFGILLTALLFTAAHVQYGFTPATLEIVVAALVLGWLRRRTNTSACVLLHFLYDALALVVFPLLP